MTAQVVTGILAIGYITLALCVLGSLIKDIKARRNSKDK
jgi:hypothetical protein